jgi:hypothetical protein
MLSNYQKNKEVIFKWRENNKEEYNNYQKDFMKKAYEKNPDEKRKKNLNYYYYKKECKRLNNILLNF